MGAYLVKRAAGEVRPRSKKGLHAQGSCLVVVFFAFGVFALFWINNIYSSKDWDWPPAHRNATSNLTSEGDQSQLVNGGMPLPNITVPSSTETAAYPRSQCTDSSWSPGSAFFTIIALTFGYFAHPRGSSVYHDSGRTWRLSPVLAFYETWILVWRMITFSRLWRAADGYDWRVISYTLLACRVGNTWSQDDYQSWILQDAKEREGVLEAGQDASASRRHEDTGSGPELLEAVQTRPHQAGRPYPGVLRQPSKDYHSPEPGEEKSEAELLAIRRTICERIFSYHLHIVDDFQYGPTTRVFIWIPMLLQAAKLLVVRGAWFARLVGFVYLLSWLTIEVLSILCAGHSLTAEEQKKAFELAQSLHAPNWIVAHQADDVARYPLYENPASICAELLLIFHGAHNWMSLARILGSYDGAGIYFSFIVFVPLVVPIPLILLGSLAVSLWRLTGLEARFGKLWYTGIIPSIKDRDWTAVYPAYLGLFSLVLEVLVFAGIRSAKEIFPCRETWKPTWYDWLG